MNRIEHTTAQMKSHLMRSKLMHKT